MSKRQRSARPRSGGSPRRRSVRRSRSSAAIPAQQAAQTKPSSPNPTPNSPAAVMWFVVLKGKEVGPLTPAQVRTLVEKGALTGATPIRKTGMEHFVRAAQVKGLLPADSIQSVTQTPPDNDSMSSAPQSLGHKPSISQSETKQESPPIDTSIHVPQGAPGLDDSCWDKSNTEALPEL